MRAVITLCFSALLLLGLRNYAVLDRLQAHRIDQLTSLHAGLVQLGLAVRGPDADGLFLAAAHGCPAPIVAGIFALDGGENERFAPLLTPATRPIYLYLGDRSAHFSRWNNALRWLGATLAMAAGRRQTPVPHKMVVVVLPRACPDLRGFDWTTLSPST